MVEPAALKDFIEHVGEHSRKQSALTEMLIGAVRALSQELQVEKAHAQLLDARLAQSEEQVERLSKAVEALRRQGWVQ